MNVIEFYSNDILDLINLGITESSFNEKNGDYIKVELKDIEESSKPTDEFLGLSQKMQVLMNQKDDEAIAKLEEENKELVDARKEQLAEIDKLLLEEAEVELHGIPENCLPTDITGEQIINIDKIIE